MEAYLQYSTTKPNTTIKPRIAKGKIQTKLSATSLQPINGGIKLANKAILGDHLKSDDSAITHSKTGERRLIVQSCASGHQSGGASSGRSWHLHRNAKLALQAAPKKSEILAGVVAYVNGYCGKDITNEQLKDVVEENGGKVRTMPSGSCTHIFVHQALSASKTEKWLKAKWNKTRYVYPAWAIDSARAGKRLSEANYASPVFSEAQASINALYGPAHDVRTVHPSAFQSIADIPPTPPRPVAPPILAPSPPPAQPQLQPRKIKIRTSAPPSPSPTGSARSSQEGKRTRKKKLPPPEEEVIVLEDSSQPEASAEQGREEEESAGEVDVDDWGMPPSGQRCGRA